MPKPTKYTELAKERQSLLKRLKEVDEEMTEYTLSNGSRIQFKSFDTISKHAKEQKLGVIWSEVKERESSNGPRLFQEFELAVRHISSSLDFKENKELLKKVKAHNRETFKSLLMLGGEITECIRASEEIFAISSQTSLSQSEVVLLSTRCRLINMLIDERHYK